MCCVCLCGQSERCLSRECCFYPENEPPEKPKPWSATACFSQLGAVRLFFHACLATRASLLGFEKLGPRRGKYGGKSVKSSVWRYTRCGCSGIAPMAKRVVPMDSPGRQLRVSRSSEPFDFFFRLAWLPEEACLASSSLI